MTDATTTDLSPEDAQALAAESDRQARVAAHLARLDDITAALGQMPDLYKERIAIYLALRDARVPYRTIADHTDATAEAVRVAVNKARTSPDPDA
jgi:hypothetical protein